MNTNKPEFSRNFMINSLGDAKKTIKIIANDEEKKALASRFKILSIERIEAKLTISSYGEEKRFIGVDASFEADVTQECVVTLEPTQEFIKEKFNVAFDSRVSNNKKDEEIEMWFDEEGPPEAVIDGTIDLGELVSEHVALAINPFPRKENAVFYYKNKGLPVEEVKNNPFEVLVKLNNKKDET